MTEERGSLRPLADSLGVLLSNPVVLEGLIAGITAFSASRRTKSASAADSTGGILDLLPGILPLLSVLMGSGGTDTQPAEQAGTAAKESNEALTDKAEQLFGNEPDESAGAFASLGDDGSGYSGYNADNGGDGGIGSDSGSDGGEDGGLTERTVDISYEDRVSQRENLLLAIRPFLSDSRRSAADAIVQVNKLSGMFRRI